MNSGIKLPFIASVFFILAGCSSPQLYQGRVLNCSGIPIASAEVGAWKNVYIPFYLPENLGTATTDQNGYFELKTGKRASFFSYPVGEIQMQSHPSRSVTSCQ